MSEPRTDQVLSWLRTMPFFGSMTREQLVAFLPRLRRRRLEDQERLCRVGDRTGCMWVVVRGSLRVLSPKGQEVARVETGDVFGIGAFLGRRPQMFEVTAVGETWLLELDRSTWEDLIAQRNDLSLALASTLAKTLASQIRQADDMIRGLLGATASEVPGGTRPAHQEKTQETGPGPSPPQTRTSRVVPSTPCAFEGSPRRSVQRIPEQDLEAFLDEMESKVGIKDPGSIRVVHSAEKPVRPKTPGL